MALQSSVGILPDPFLRPMHVILCGRRLFRLNFFNSLIYINRVIWLGALDILDLRPPSCAEMTFCQQAMDLEVTVDG